MDNNSKSMKSVMVKIKGHAFIFDKEDMELVNRYSWSVFNNNRGHVYLQTYVPFMDVDGVQRSRQDRFHRMIMGLIPGDGKVVDHINRNTRDNRKANLRVVSQSENSINRARKNGGPLKSGNGYIVRLMKDGEGFYFGKYQDLETATKVFDDAYKSIYGAD